MERKGVFAKMDIEPFDNFINSLRESLHKGLPGETVQRTMAPAARLKLMEHTIPDETTRMSAVLIPIFPHEGRAHIVFIKRQTYDGIHSAQVAFPGGKKEESDDNMLETALREAEEEVGIRPESVTILGTLTPLFIPISNYLVLPVIGILKERPTFYPNLQEVEYIIEMPICQLLQPNSRSVITQNLGGLPLSTPHFKAGEDMIWGATAMILAEFIELIQPSSCY
ncbi:NUDIX hydrolase [Williamwhitmania taraxaci]|uniref:NUDIX domain-containing protein n=1 Tax=Williamwhitmania taraxaci TaxID=1640674 RepID=A0A1G6RWE0_9BACT|nr:CoA pyrophosphatase [Williamwhitmania taraxaci]SDD08246.1 NUDIX domain-containing protein [Williamwhitmania taraxaci]